VLVDWLVLHALLLRGWHTIAPLPHESCDRSVGQGTTDIESDAHHRHSPTATNFESWKLLTSPISAVCTLRGAKHRYAAFSQMMASATLPMVIDATLNAYSVVAHSC